MTLKPDAASLADPPARKDVAVLLGGCGDCRNALATLIDAAAPQCCPDPQRAMLRLTLNDAVPEVIARAPVVLMLLHRAGAALPKGAEPTDRVLNSLPDAAQLALTALWHVYQAPVLHAPVMAMLHDVLQEIVAADALPLAFATSTPGALAEVQAVCRNGCNLTRPCKRKLHRQSAKPRLESAAIPKMMNSWCVCYA